LIFYTYVLRSLKDRNLYIGYTSDIQRRLTEHNSGKTKSTKSRIPFELIFFEEFETRSGAMKREKFLKTGIGKDFIKLKMQELSA
jgi:putative endonuclease